MRELAALDRPPRILLVEDNPDDAKLTQLAFQHAQVEVEFHVVDTGEKALDFLFQQGAYSAAPRPDLVLLDLNLPGTDGRTVLRQAKDDPLLRRIPIIVLSTSEADVDLALAYSLYANAYLTKPIGMDEWDEVVQSFGHFWMKSAKFPPPPTPRKP